MRDVLSLDRIKLIEQAIREFSDGKFLLVSDDEDRENEGDLLIAAEHATPEAINFMITHGKGLVCLTVSETIARQKKLVPMVQQNRDHLGTAFSASVDATVLHGVTTGISAWDRAKTIQVVISEEYGPGDIQAPGHMFPLIAKPGLLKTRRGHTEAGVEMARLAGCKHEAAVIVEVIKDDGEMARRDDLLKMAEKFGITYLTIDDLCKYVAQLELQSQLEPA
jgi:3,4-dihydroxy 2-butanone 4-phosphate synthase / GTP cyclohydrolase II